MSVPLRYMARIIAGQAPAGDTVSDLMVGFPFLQGNAEFGLEHPTPRYECEVPSKTCEAGDLLVSVRAPVGAMNTADRPYGIGRGLVALRPTSGVDGRFLRYALIAHMHGLHAVSGGTTFSAVTAQDVALVRLPRPLPEDQRRIADFLDDQVALLDRAHSLVGARKDLLQESFRAHLAHTILLPRNETMRARLIDMFEFEHNGIWGSEPDGGADDVRCVRVADFDRFAYRVVDPPTIRRVPSGQRGPRLLRRGDVLLEKSGGTLDKPVGCAVMYEGSEAAVCSNFVAALRPKATVNPAFAGLVMAAHYQTRRNGPFVNQTTGIQNLDSAAYLRLHIGIPNIREQARCVEYVLSYRQQCEDALALLTRQQRLLGERKQALITAAVTGQFDVTTARGVA